MTRKEQLNINSNYYLENEEGMIPFKQLNFEEPFKIKNKAVFDKIYIKVVYNWGKSDANFTYIVYNPHFPDLYVNHYNHIEDDFLIEPLSIEEFENWYNNSPYKRKFEKELNKWEG